MGKVYTLQQPHTACSRNREAQTKNYLIESLKYNLLLQHLLIVWYLTVSTFTAKMSKYMFVLFIKSFGFWEKKLTQWSINCVQFFNDHEIQYDIL